MMITAIASAGAMSLAQGASAYFWESLVSSDQIGAWAYDPLTVSASGGVSQVTVKFTPLQPTVWPGSSQPVAYSVHRYAINCAANTFATLGGSNYGVDGSVVSPAQAAASQPVQAGSFMPYVARKVCN